MVHRVIRCVLLLLCVGQLAVASAANGDPLSCECADDRSIDQTGKINVLMIAVDDLNDWIGCLNGHPQTHTPNLDRLAQQGVLFSNAHCPSTACNPSRAAIFSGQWPWKTGVWNNKSPRLFTQHPDITVLPRLLNDNGYQTFGCGKLMHSSSVANRLMLEDSYNPEQRWSPFSREAVRYLDSEQGSKGSRNPKHLATLYSGDIVRLPVNRMPSDRNPAKRDGESFDWGGMPVSDDAMGDTLITDWAIGKIQEMNHSAPFFLGVGYYRPHIPLFAPQQYFERFEEEEVILPKVKSTDLEDLSDAGKRWALEADTAGLHSTVLEYEQWSAAVKAYLACTTYVDRQIGRLMDCLSQSDAATNTVVVLFSDHGWHLGEKQHWGKWTGWERSTRVPLIIVPPLSQSSRNYKRGLVCDAPVNLIDLYPTICDLCELGHDLDLDGQSLRPLLQDVDSALAREFSLSVFDQGNYSLRNQRFRFIQYADGSEELYDMTQDPAEWNNLASAVEYEPVIERFREELSELVRQSQ